MFLFELNFPTSFSLRCIEMKKVILTREISVLQLFDNPYISDDIKYYMYNKFYTLPSMERIRSLERIRFILLEFWAK